MSTYSELIGSFIRTGDFPLEADYIFDTEDDLKEYYSDELNSTLLYQGWLKVVKDDGEGNQALYWVTVNDGEYEFTKLISGNSVDEILSQLESLQEALQEEIQNRIDADDELRGAEDTSDFPEGLTNLLELANALSELQSEVSLYKEELKATVGTEDDDIISYLQTLPYKSLTEVATILDQFINGTDDETDIIDTLPEIEAFLEGYTNSDTLQVILETLYNDILGDPLPSEDFRTLRGIEDFVRILQTTLQAVDANLQTELDQTQVGVGLSGDGSYNADAETYYLQNATSVMNALKILDEKIHEAISGISFTVENDDVIELSVEQDCNDTKLMAKLLLSNADGNDLIKKDDGLYYNVSTTYESGVLTVYVNGKIASQHILGLSAIVDSATYDSTNEQIVIVFKLQSGDTQTVNIPVGAIIREWDVDNSQDKVVHLERTVSIEGTDLLSADVNIYPSKYNILQKVDSALYVDGTSDSITYNDTTLTVILDQILAKADALDEAVSTNASDIKDLQSEVSSLEEKITDVSNSITDESDAIAALQLKDIELEAALNNEITRATAAEDTLTTQVGWLADQLTNVNESITNLQVEDVTLQAAIDTEQVRAEAAETNLQNEIDALKAVDEELQDELDTFKFTFYWHDV